MSSQPSHSRRIEYRLRAACSEVADLVAREQADPAGQVLSRYPDLAVDAESAIELIYSEYRALDENQRRPESDQWLERFPEHRPRLERLLKLHDLLDEQAELDPHSGTAASEPTSGAPSALGSIGNYQLIAEIGRGGMGVVYRARQQGLGRIVAVKVLRGSDGHGLERTRFQREAEAIASLQHPNIVQVHEVGCVDDQAYLSMELVEGASLDVWSSTKARSNHEIASLLKSLADAIQYAHARGIVHRDLKPANVLMMPSGAPKIVDFGLAKRLSDSDRAETVSGTLLGTPCYMSPEQAAGNSKSIGPSTDIYSLGVILYQLLTRKLPFNGKSTVETLQHIVHRDPTPPSKLDRQIPRDLETICLKCLAKEIPRRYATAEELSSDLARFLDHRPILARRATLMERTIQASRRHPEVAVLLGALVVLTCGSLFVLLRQQLHLQDFQEKVHSSAQMAAAQQLRASEAEAAYEASLRKARELIGRTTDLGLRLENEPGLDQTRRKAFEDAVTYYEEFLGQHSDDPLIRLEAAQAAIRSAAMHGELGLWSQAENRLKQADQWLSQMQDDRKAQWIRSDCLVQTANVQRRLGRWRDSETTFLQAIEIVDGLLESNPYNSDFLIRLANAKANLCVIYRTQRRWDESIATYLEALNSCLRASHIVVGQTPQSNESESGDTQALVQARVHESRMLRESVAGSPSRIKRLVTNCFGELALSLDDIGEVLRIKSMLPSAEECLREAVALRLLILENTRNNRGIEQYVARGQTHLAAVLLDTNRPLEARQLLSEAVRLLANLSRDFPDRVVYRTEWCQSLIQMARYHIAVDDLAAARDSVKEAISIQEQLFASHPEIEWVRLELANAFVLQARIEQRAGKQDEAFTALRRAIELAPNNPQPLNNFAWVLAFDPMVKPELANQAVELSEKAISLAPENANYWNTNALALFRAAQYEEADRAVDRSMQLSNGGTITDWFIQAMILAKLDRPAEASQWHQRAEARRLAQNALGQDLIQFSKEASAVIAQAGRPSGD